MFVRVFALLPLALFASASVIKARDGGSGNQCSTGAMNCCDSLQKADGSNQWLAKRGVADVAAAVIPLIGINCTPLNVLALGGNSCTKQVACCDDNETNGLGNVQCTPVNANL